MGKEESGEGGSNLSTRVCIHDGRVGYPPPTLPSWIWPLNMEGAVGVMRRVANARLAVKRRVAYPAVMNAAPGAIFMTG